MGLGKSIKGMGTSELYHLEPDIFLRRVSDTFQVNISEFYIDGDEQNFNAPSSAYLESISVHDFHSMQKKPLLSL
ncbi:hypothetical protein ADIARSV_0021 [Arcticibacter svalbardensis MN12-7]|uniref:Uncharacterized protein n=1 Tax=Arcticibacter svalbardensis MN12-7 TaxID=1150600 RepID=R9GYM8_9SPHI|nr:hypothetical protein [Arcticibacter svalbardensis]EOR96758.1 hypothetical protein ADIARSV_0021 [Arcticibacter svalbardensis MN12-7]